MATAFYITAAIAILATLMVVTGRHAVHALLNLVVSLFAVAVMFYLLGAPFAAALEIIVYAGAIMVLFVFVIMMLNLGPETIEQERRWLRPGVWIAPSLLTALLLWQWLWILEQGVSVDVAGNTVSARAVGVSLFSEYLLVVEMAGLLLLAALVGAFHLGRRRDGETDMNEEGEEP